MCNRPPAVAFQSPAQPQGRRHSTRHRANLLQLTSRSAISVTVALLLNQAALAQARPSAPDNAKPAQVTRSATSTATHTIDIPSGDLATALSTLAKQTGADLVYRPEQVAGIKTAGLKGELTTTEAINRLLKGTTLTLSTNAAGALLIAQPKPTAGLAAPDRANLAKQTSSSAGPTRLAQNTTEGSDPDSPVSAEEPDRNKGISEILIKGSKLLDMDIERTVDDIQPYVIFDRTSIEQSGAANIEEFLSQRLAMDAQKGSSSQGAGVAGTNRSQIDLRGLGTDHTLILIDGRRTANSVTLGTVEQQDVNGIPMSAVERIEVLPGTAGGIYGGDATGGVVNIILRRDYQGAAITVGYDRSFDTNDARRKVQFTTGFNLEEGKTNVLIAGSWTDGNPLARQDRGFIQQYRSEGFANQPAEWLPPASAPLGYTTNIASASGGNLVLNNGTPLNSNITSVPVGYTGAAADNGAGLVANAGRYNFNLANTAQAGRQSLETNPTVESINVTVRRQFGSLVQAFLEGSASNNTSHSISNSINSRYSLAAGTPNNPFQQDINITVPVAGDFDSSSRTTDRRAVAGVIVQLPWGWQSETDYIWSQTTVHTVEPGNLLLGSYSPINTALQTNPALNPIRDTNLYPLNFSPYLSTYVSGPFETTSKDATLLFGGPVGSLPGGRPYLNIKFEHRNEDFGGGTEQYLGNSVAQYLGDYPSKSQSVDSVYAELRLPLVSERNNIPFVQDLEAQLSGRRDDYRTDGTDDYLSDPTQPVTRVVNKFHSTNPTLGLKWQPVEDVAVRASYGKGFLPPSVVQLTPSAIFTLYDEGLIDPLRGNTPLGTLPNGVRYGGNPNLQPEQSKTWSAGLILTPRWLVGLRLSVDYVNITETGQIAQDPQGEQGLINDASLFPGRVVRAAPSAADLARGWAGPITFIDDSLLNVAVAKTQAYDARLDYRLETQARGVFMFYVTGTYTTGFQTQAIVGAPLIDNVGFTAQGPGNDVLRFKGSMGLAWSKRQWTLGWNTRYLDSYYVYGAAAYPLEPADVSERAYLTQEQGSARVPSQMYHDFFASYQSTSKNPFLERTNIMFGIRNVLNTKPPREGETYSAYGDPRLASFYLNFTRSFGN